MSLSLSFFVSRLGGEGNLLLTSPPHIAHLFPAPQAQDSPHQSPHFVFWGRGPLSPWPHLGPCPLNLSPASPPPPSGWLLSPTFPRTPSPPSLFCVTVPLPLLTPSSQPPLRPLPGLFFTPPHPRLMPSLVLDNYQIYQWGERSACVSCLLSGPGGGGVVSPVLAPMAG